MTTTTGREVSLLYPVIQQSLPFAQKLGFGLSEPLPANSPTTLGKHAWMDLPGNNVLNRRIRILRRKNDPEAPWVTFWTYPGSEGEAPILECAEHWANGEEFERVDRASFELRAALFNRSESHRDKLIEASLQILTQSRLSAFFVSARELLTGPEKNTLDEILRANPDPQALSKSQMDALTLLLLERRRVWVNRLN